jgi:predicted outer membrane protein
MSAFGRMHWGVAAAGFMCLVAGSAISQREAGERAATQSRDNISDRAITDQSEPSTQLQQDRVRTTQRTRLGERNVQRQAGGQTQEVEKFLAGCLLAKNKAEIEFAQLAQQQSQNPQVKQFAQMLEQDHQKIVQQLEQLAGGQASQTSTRTDSQSQISASGQNDAQRQPSDTTRLPGSPGATQTTRSQTQTEAYGSQEMTGPIAQLAQIEKQIGERQKQAMLDELQQKSGAEFDKCYVGSQVSSHMQSLAALEVISQQQQGKLAQVAQQAQPTVQQHLDHAKQLAKQLESGGQPRSQAERQTPPRTQRQ